MMTEPDGRKVKAAGSFQQMSVEASDAIGRYPSRCRSRCRRCVLKSDSHVTTRPRVPWRVDLPESSPDGFPENRLQDEWPPLPQCMEAGDRCPRQWVPAESISSGWPLAEPMG